MADIRLAVDFLAHPKTIMLQSEHGAEAVLALLRLWSFAAVYRTKGVLRGLTKERIALTAGCSVEVIDAMIGEFVDEAPDGVFKLHNWKKHQGWIYHAEERSERGRKAAGARWADNEDEPEEEKPAKPPKKKTPSNGSATPAKNPLVFLSDFPEVFQQSEDFKEAWALWVQHRKEKKSALHKLPTGSKEAIRKLGKLTPAHAAAAIRYSVENQYTGLFPDDVKPPTTANASGGRFSGVSQKGGE